MKNNCWLIEPRVLYKGIEAAKKGNYRRHRHAIQSYVESFGYGVVRELVDMELEKICMKNRMFPITENRAKVN
jgi:methionine aminopeptidase